MLVYSKDISPIVSESIFAKEILELVEENFTCTSTQNDKKYAK